MTVVSVVLSSDAYRHSEGTQQDPSARTAGDFGQSLASPHVLHPPVLYIQVLTVRRLLNTPHGPLMCLGRVWCSDPMPIGTQKAPSARTVGEFGQSLANPYVSHLPALYIQVLAVQHLLHT